MKRWIATALVSSAVIAHAQSPAPATPPAAGASAPAALPTSPAKKELVRRILLAQQPNLEGIARNMVERAPAQMMQEAGRYLQSQVPPEKREAVSETIKAELKKYIDESVPIVRASALKVAPSTLGAEFEQKFTEDELKTILAWMESPVNKKYLQAIGEMQNDFMQKLGADAGPIIEPKLRALEDKTRIALGAPAPGAAASPSAAASAAPAKSGSKTAPKASSK
jgi:hypothetical protein